MRSRVRRWLTTGSVMAAALALAALAPADAQVAPAGAEGPVAPVGEHNAPAAAAPETQGPTNAPAQAGPPASPVPTFQWHAGIDVAAGYTTNAYAASSPGDLSDEFTRAQINLSAQYLGPRLSASLAYSLSSDYYARFHNLDRLENYLSAAAESEVITDTLFLHASAFATPTALTRVGSLSSSGGSISDFNSRDSYGYSFSPELRLHFEDFATSILTGSQGGVFFVRPSTGNPGVPIPIGDVQNALSTSVSEELVSGTYFGRLQWDFSGNYTEINEQFQTERQESGTGTLSYALTRWLTVMGTGGYAEFKSTVPLSKNLNGPIGFGGFTFRNGEDFTLTAEAGTQYNFPVYQGSLHWNLTPLTSIVGDVNDSVTTPQSNILSNLGNFTPGATGVTVPPTTPQIPSSNSFGSFGGQFNSPTPVSPYGLSLDNFVYRQRRANLAMIHTAERTNYTLSFYGTERDRLTNVVLPYGNRDSYYGVSLGATRQMRADLTGGASISYSLANEFGGHDRILGLNAGLNYKLSQTFAVYLQTNYLDRSGAHLVGVPNIGASEAEVLVGIQAGF